MGFVYVKDCLFCEFLTKVYKCTFAHKLVLKCAVFCYRLILHSKLASLTGLGIFVCVCASSGWTAKEMMQLSKKSVEAADNIHLSIFIQYWLFNSLRPNSFLHRYFWEQFLHPWVSEGNLLPHRTVFWTNCMSIVFHLLAVWLRSRADHSVSLFNIFSAFRSDRANSGDHPLAMHFMETYWFSFYLREHI